MLAADLLPYAGNLQILAPVAGAPGFEFERRDVRDALTLQSPFHGFHPTVVHLAA